jgi:RNA recognition motif-containing protein
VFVGNLDYGVTKEELGSLLGGAGTLVDLHLPADRETGRPRGFAFAEFATEAQAAEAIRRFDQAEMRGRRLSIRVADDRPRRGGGPGPSLLAPPPDPGPFGGGGFGGGGGRPGDRRAFKSKGSRRGLRRRKRSL